MVEKTMVERGMEALADTVAKAADALRDARTLASEVFANDDGEGRAIAVDIRGNALSSNGRFIKENGKEIATLLVEAYKDGGLPEDAPLHYDNAKDQWRFTKGERTVAVDADQITLVTAEYVGTSWAERTFTNDPRPHYTINQMHAPRLSGGAMTFADTTEIRAEKGTNESGIPGDHYASPAFNDEIAKLVANQRINFGKDIMLEDGDGHGKVHIVPVMVPKDAPQR